MTEFNAAYAGAYDGLYQEKDYEAECDLVAAALARHGGEKHRTRRTARILDLGCGTGNHALPLAWRGYEVVGVDRSPHMLAAARAKSPEGSKGDTAARFVEGDVRSVDLGETFDAVLFMFAVLGYQLSNDDVLAALRTARRHVRGDGLLIFDVWYGPAVLTERPGDRVKVTTGKDGRILRATSGRLDVERHLCEVSYRLWKLDGKAEETAETEELHRMRYFFPQELRLFLEVAGFRLAALTAFPTLDQPCDETTWNAFAVAVAS